MSSKWARSIEGKIAAAQLAYANSYQRLMRAQELRDEAARVHVRRGEQLAKLRQQQNRQEEQP